MYRQSVQHYTVAVSGASEGWNALLGCRTLVGKFELVIRNGTTQSCNSSLTSLMTFCSAADAGDAEASAQISGIHQTLVQQAPGQT